MSHSHTIPVPFGMSPEESWAEICTMGRLVNAPQRDEDCAWATIDCDGEECKQIEKSPTFRRYYNDVLIEGPPEDAR